MWQCGNKCLFFCIFNSQTLILCTMATIVVSGWKCNPCQPGGAEPRHINWQGIHFELGTLLRPECWQLIDRRARTHTHTQWRRNVHVAQHRVTMCTLQCRLWGIERLLAWPTCIQWTFGGGIFHMGMWKYMLDPDYYDLAIKNSQLAARRRTPGEKVMMNGIFFTVVIV